MKPCLSPGIGVGKSLVPSPWRRRKRRTFSTAIVSFATVFFASKKMVISDTYNTLAISVSSYRDFVDVIYQHSYVFC